MVTSRKGFSLVELLIVVTLVGIMAAIAAPRLRVSPRTQVRLAARQLAQDLEFTRTRALGARSTARLAFVTPHRGYVSYLDFDRDGVFVQSAEEIDSLGGFRGRVFETGINFGRAGTVPDLPALPGAGAITLPGERIEFDSRGLSLPFGAKGVIYLTHTDDPTAVAAVSITGAAGIRSWVYRGGSWQ
jgi:prepilin-type N-terminal cleavage/methylation domain-containing protein